MGKHSQKHKNRDKIVDRYAMDNHHCINQSCWWRSVEENLYRILCSSHSNLHVLFGNKLPHEILETLIATIFKPMTEELKADLLEVLREHKGHEYKNKTFKWQFPKQWPFSWKL